MAVNQGGSQAIVLQLEFFCASSSVSFSLSFLVFNCWHSTYQGYVKTVDYAVAKAEWVGLGGLFRGPGWTEWREIHTVLLLPDTHTHTHAHVHQMVQEGGLNKHPCTDTHLLADGRLCVHCPLMNVYWESEGPSSFSWLSMRCSIMAMVIRSSLPQ